MKSNIKTAQNDEGKLPYSPLLCVILLLGTGIFVKLTAATQVFHFMH